MNLPYVDRIWRIKNSLPLETNQSAAEALGKLEPLFQTDNTVYSVGGHTLTYGNKNPAPQNKIATFTRGTLRVDAGEGGGLRLFYDLTSPALLFCFLAPLLFLAFSQFILAVGEWEKPTAAEAVLEKKKEAEEKEKDKQKAAMPMNPIDKFLGAPRPEMPKDEKDDKKKDKDKSGGNKRSATPAYVFAGLFAALYLIGRFLEPWLIRRTFRKALAGEDVMGVAAPAQ